MQKCPPARCGTAHSGRGRAPAATPCRCAGPARGDRWTRSCPRARSRWHRCPDLGSLANAEMSTGARNSTLPMPRRPTTKFGARRCAVCCFASCGASGRSSSSSSVTSSSSETAAASSSRPPRCSHGPRLHVAGPSKQRPVRNRLGRITGWRPPPHRCYQKRQKQCLRWYPKQSPRDSCNLAWQPAGFGIADTPPASKSGTGSTVPASISFAGESSLPCFERSIIRRGGRCARRKKAVGKQMSSARAPNKEPMVLAGEVDDACN